MHLLEDTTITLFGSARRRPKEFGPVWSLLFAPLLVIAALVSLPIAPILGWTRSRKKLRLAEVVAKQNRVISWPEFVQAAEQKRGTLIVEGDPRKSPKLWWTTEDVRTRSPYPCSYDLKTLFDRSFRPFQAWCCERYTSPQKGTAFLVLGGEDQRHGFALGNHENEHGTGIFEGLPTVLTLGRRVRK